jgi:hypothetical protein
MNKTIVLTIVGALFFYEGTRAQQFVVDGIKYNVTSEENRKVEVVGGYKYYRGDIVIPSNVEYDDVSYRVTSVGNDAFFFCNEMTSLVIPNSVTVIGDRAFAYCWNAGDIQVPDNVVSIGEEAFLVCSGIRNITIPASVTSIGENAFALFSENDPDVNTYYIATLNWNSNLDFSSIASSFLGEFNGVRDINVRQLVIGDNVTRFAFYDYSSDAHINYLKTIESVTVDAQNPVFDDRNSCNAIINTSQNKLVAGLSNTVIPDDVTAIGECAFLNCDAITSIAIPSSVTTIGYSAFEGCDNLISIEISNSAISFTDAFKCCSSITTIVLSGPITSIVDDAFRNWENLTSVVIPNTVTSIGNNAFAGCSGLISITIPNSVTYIGDGAFSGTGLTSITIPSGITIIGSYAFSGCSSLESVIIEEGVEVIPDRAFEGCINLSSLYVPSTVTYVATNAFNQVNNLDYVYWNTNVVGLFTGDAQVRKERHIGKLVIGKDMTEIQMANFWGGGISHFEVDEDNPVFDSRGDCDGIIITASNTLFKGCINTRIPNGVTAIGDSSLEDIYDLESITIPNSVVSIGGSSFAGCNNLTSLIIPSGVTSIGDYALYNCSSLTSINLPDVTSIGNSCFRGCSMLTSITIPETAVSIGNSAFEDCSSLTAIVIPASVTSIGNDAFKSTGLESIVVDGENDVYDSRNNCNAIIRTETNELLLGSDNTVIPEGVERIKGYAFSGCSGLSSVFIPSSVTYIEDNAFEKTGLESIVVDGENDVYDSRNNCNAVIQTSTNTLIVGSKNTIIPSEVVSIKNAAFRGYTAIETISIPDCVISIGWSAFRGCSSLASVYVYSDEAPSLSGNTVFGENAAGRKFYVFSDLVESYRNASGWNNYYVDDIDAIPALTANNAGGTLGNWCTYYNGMASVKMPDDVIIYKASIDGERIVLTQVDGHIVSKGEAVLLNTNNSTIVLESAQGMIAGDFEGNSLRGVDYSAAQDENKTYYVLSKIGDDFGFYKLNPEVSLSPNKAYLEVDNRSLAQIRTFYSVGSTDGIVDGMVNINPAIDDTDGWYTIYGTKLIGKPVIKGLYIHNGQKVVIE